MEYIFVDELSRILCGDDGSVYVRAGQLSDIYYGVSSNPRVNESTIISTFLTASGNVGSVSGRLYTFPISYTYKYWCIPDINTGDKIIYQILHNDDNTILAYDSYYSYYQTSPTPDQSITYGKLAINGVTYRIYRTKIKTSSNNEQYVYSF